MDTGRLARQRGNDMAWAELNRQVCDGCPVCGERYDAPHDETYTRDEIAYEYTCSNCGTVYTKLFAYSETIWRPEDERQA